MDKKSVIRFASLVTAVLISASSFPRLCATVSAEQANNSVTAAAGEASLVSYKTYAADMAERKNAEKSITLSSDAARVYGSAARKGVNGKSAVVFSKTGCGAEWKVSVPEDALYNIRLSYTAVDTGVDYAFTLKTDGRVGILSQRKSRFFHSLSETDVLADHGVLLRKQAGPAASDSGTAPAF